MIDMDITEEVHQDQCVESPRMVVDVEVHVRPETPTSPLSPSTPSTPSTPGTPESPGTPQTPDSPYTPATPARILDIVSFDDPPSNFSPAQNAPRKKRVQIVEKRRRMMRRNALTNFFREGSRSISKVFPESPSPDQVKWKHISSRFHSKKRNRKQKKEQKVHEEIKKSTVTPSSQTPLKIYSSAKSETITRLSTTKDVRADRNGTIDSVASDESILSSYSILEKLKEFVTEESEENSDEISEDGIIEDWIRTFINTCYRQIKDVIMTTNGLLSQHVDLNGHGLIAGQQNFIKVYTIPTWPQVRILQDKANQRYIALKKSHALSWFVLPRANPKLNQQWVCYPILSMNTFENELRMSEDNSMQRMLLRMMMLKCFNKIYKNDIVPIKFDIKNILIVSSSCGLIIVFREGKDELDIKTLNILKCETLSEVPVEWAIVKNEVKESMKHFFYRLNIISFLISSTWPLDYLAFTLAKLMMDCDS